MKNVTLTGVLYWAAVVVLLGCFVLLASGCTDRFRYKHEYTDPNGILHTVLITYSEGVGNHDKKAVEIILGDGASATLGQSITNQDEFMKVLTQYGLTLQKLAEVWLTAPTFGVGLPLDNK